MTRRVSVEWPDAAPFAGRDGRPIRLLATSDEVDSALEHLVNRAGLGQLDGVIGCGDLSPAWLAFLADAFRVPLVYVRGNHDRGGGWEQERPNAPRPMESGTLTDLAGIQIGGLEWPGVAQRGNERHPRRAWLDALRLAWRWLVRRLRRGQRPLVVISHAPPTGFGDAPRDPYHMGFDAYRWLLDRLRPPLWLHGHTTAASVEDLECRCRETKLVNVTGAVLVELTPPGTTTNGGWAGQSAQQKERA
jgi:Icc-related predicted phosphoesterase